MVLLTLMPPWGRPTLPIGLGYLSQFLTAHGVQHEVQDHNLEIFERVDASLSELWQPCNARRWVDPGQFSDTLSRLEPLVERAVERLAHSDARLVGFSVNQSNARLSAEVARRLRQRCPGRTIIFGGLGVYIPGERRQFFAPGVVDLFVMGEGEVTLLRAVERLRAGQGLDGMTGTLVHPEQEAFVPRPPLDLELYPWPTYAAFDVTRYPDGGQPMPVILGRGCVCRCAFCGDYPFWGKFRSRDGEQVARELEHHVRRWGVSRFEFNDLAINGDLVALERMCDRIIELGLPVSWSSYATISEMPDYLPAKLRRSGCFMLRFGLESASGPVLRRMRKPHRAELASRVLERMSGAGILCNIGLMVGFPDETDGELEETCAFLRANQAHIHEVDSLSLFYIKPLSEVERHPQRYGIRFPRDNTIRHSHWEGADGSTYARRVARAERLIASIESTTIRFQRCNLFGL